MNSLQRLKSEPDAEAREKSPEIRAERHESVGPDPPPASSQNLTTFNTKVINTADLNDSREINLEYLKHVVLKFMSSREAEVRRLRVRVRVRVRRLNGGSLFCVLNLSGSWFQSSSISRPLVNLCVLLHQAFQLIRAVSVLLNFTREEEEMLKQTLEYKVGWRFICPQCVHIVFANDS